jgi:pectate lyase
MISGCNERKPRTWAGRVWLRFVQAVACLIALSGQASNAEDATRYSNAVKTYYDNVLRHGRDTYGDQTPLFADGLDIEKRQAVVSANDMVICNFACQQYLLRGLVGLSLLSGDSRYREAAEEVTAYVLEHLVHRKSGLIHWGGHAFWDLTNDRPAFSPHNSHELKCAFPYYELLYEVDPDATKKFIEAFWKVHVDLSDPSMMFGRHAKMDADPSQPRHVRPGELAFHNTGADLIYAAAFLHQKTGDEIWLSRAVGLAERFSRLRNPRTGLSPEILDVLRDPDFCRRVDSEQLRVRRSSEHTGRLGGRARQYALAQLVASQTLPDEAGWRLVDWAVADLHAYAEYGYDDSTKGFYGMLRTETGQRIRFSEVHWTPGFYFPPCKFQKNLGLPILFHAYAKAYKFSSDPVLLKTATNCLNVLGMRTDSQNLDLARVPEGMLNSDTAAQLIQGLLELYEADGTRWYLIAAEVVADQSLGLFFDGQFFAAWPGEFRQSPVNQALPLALLRLAAVLERKRITLPVDPGGLGMEPVWNYSISYIDGDFALRWQWGKHFTDLHAEGGQIVCRIGDRSPHRRQEGGLWDHAGIWRLKAKWSDLENVFDEQRGMIFEPSARFIPREMTKLGESQVLVEHWLSGRERPPYLGVRSRYELAAPRFLDWTLEVAPLEAGYGDLALRATAYLDAAASPEVGVWAENGSVAVPVRGNQESRFGPGKHGGPSSYLASRPMFHTRIGEVALVFMFRPKSPIEFLAAGPSNSSRGGLRGFLWHIDSAKKDQAYTLDVRIGLFPVSSIDSLDNAYRQWAK